MSPELLQRLEEQTHAPAGIAALVPVEQLRQLLEERAVLLRACERAELRADMGRPPKCVVEVLSAAMAKATQP